MSLGPIALSAFMICGQGADYVSTQRALARCPTCRESNPLMSSPAVMLTAKGAVVAAGTVAVVKLWPKHKAEAVALAVVIGGIGFAMAKHNEGVGR